MNEKVIVRSPINNEVIAERNLANNEDVNTVLDSAKKEQKNWQKKSIDERAEILKKFVEIFCRDIDKLSHELTMMIGRPIQYTPGEIKGTRERALTMIDMASDALSPIKLKSEPGFDRMIKRSPLGVVFSIAAWNYPYLIAVNSVIPALMAGNTVVLKHSEQTLLCSERFFKAFQEAGLPTGVFQYLHLSHEVTAKVIKDTRVDYVAFTGSVAGGHAINKAASGRFINTGLELGGKDPAFVCEDANLEIAAESLVDGAFFNSGQSCCGIERIYVKEQVYDDFLDKFINLTNQYVLGNPFEKGTTLGPLVKQTGADFIREQVKLAVNNGAKRLIDVKQFKLDDGLSNYLAPQILINTDHSMSIMKDESFGPVVGIMKVKTDDEAIQLMNDSDFGLTASIWASDIEKAMHIGDQVETGTWFMNRCDYLDPQLAWTGVKNTGKGCTLSKVGYEFLTRPKSYHLKI
jgi:acyl-CoA reductase-like NAD-dependent aldehyde dehydrogenase